MKNEEQQLVSRFKAGDKSALNELVKIWHQSFCKKAFWIIKDKNLSKDVAQESWQVIIDKISDLKDNSSFGAWAMRIVYTKSFDALRKQNSERLKNLNFKKESNIYESNYSENTDLTDLMHSSIQQLSKSKQEVLKLFYIEEYSLKEIAQILKISEGTVKSRLFHAREKLKTILKNKNYEN